MEIEFAALRPLLELLEQYGISKQELIAAVTTRDGIKPKKAELNSSHTQNSLNTAVTLSNDPSFVLRLGRNLDFSSLGTIGFAIQSCANLRNGLKLAIRYHTLLKSGVVWILSFQKDEVVLQLNVEMVDPYQQQLITELVFSQFFALTEFLTGKNFYATQINLNYPKPDYYRKYKKYLPAKVEFDQTENQIIFPEAILDLPIRTANPAGQVIFQQQCEELLLDLNRIENTSSVVRRLLIQSAGEFPSLVQVAKKLYMSESTLRRRLDSESTSFRTLCDEVKNVLAKKYLTETELTVADIAHLLDYTDTANFRRAFVRWNKIPPNEYRQN